MGQIKKASPEDILALQLWSIHVSKATESAARFPYCWRICHRIILTDQSNRDQGLRKTNHGTIHRWSASTNSTNIDLIQSLNHLRSSSTSTYNRGSKSFQPFFLELDTTAISNQHHHTNNYKHQSHTSHRYNHCPCRPSLSDMNRYHSLFCLRGTRPQTVDMPIT